MRSFLLPRVSVKKMVLWICLCLTWTRPSLPGWSRSKSSAVRVQTRPIFLSLERARSLRIDPIDVQIMQKQFASVRELPRTRSSFGNSTNILEIDDHREPSFRRLFTHKTWQRYTGGTTLERTWRLLRNWPFCLVMQATWPLLLFSILWSFFVSAVVPTQLLLQWSRGLQATMYLQGTAIGLLLVFRTEGAYRRLEEARKEWSNIIFLVREIVTKTLVACEYPIVCDVARYLCAFSWSLRDQMREREDREDILDCLLDSQEATWVKSQRSKPLALLGRVRQALQRECDDGDLNPTQHYAIDMNIQELHRIVAACERVFSSPIPPNMARHGVRSLILWLLGIPIVLAGSLHPALIALCVASTTYIYFGINELGVQVEQPFKIMPLWQLCHMVTYNIEEALSSPELPLRIKRRREIEESLEFDRYDGSIPM